MDLWNLSIVLLYYKRLLTLLTVCHVWYWKHCCLSNIRGNIPPPNSILIFQLNSVQFNSLNNMNPIVYTIQQRGVAIIGRPKRNPYSRACNILYRKKRKNNSIICMFNGFIYHLTGMSWYNFPPSHLTEDSEVTKAYYLFKELEAMKTVSHLPQFPTLIGYVDSFPYQSIIMEYLADESAPTPVTLHHVLKYPELTDSQIIKVNI